MKSNATGNQKVKRLQMNAAGNIQSVFLTILTMVKMNVAEILFLNPIRVSAVLKTNSKSAEINSVLIQSLARLRGNLRNKRTVILRC